MSVAIKNALVNLNQSIDKIETSLEKHRKKLKTVQPDLFAAPVKVAAKDVQDTGTIVHFDRSALAKKLDMTIARVEQLLGEA